MTVEQLVDYLRISVNVQDPCDPTAVDSAYLTLNDDGIKLFLEAVLSRDFPTVHSLDSLPSESTYALILLAKKELYFTLATKRSGDYDITADNNNNLRRSQRFDHYMTLIKQVDEEYNRYIDDGGAGGHTLTSYDVLLSNRYATARNYEKGVAPALTLYVGGVTATTIELEWSVKMNQFKEFKVYISDSTILDPFVMGNKVSSKATLVATIYDPQQKKCRLENLTPNTTYHVVVSASEMSNLKGYAEVVVATESE